MATQRLSNELSQYSKSITDTDHILPAKLVGDNLFEWDIVFLGPVDTPYRGGRFRLRLTFPADYPFKPPKARLLTKMYHCGVPVSGSDPGCLDILKENWSPALTAYRVANAIFNVLFRDPNIDDPLVPEIATLYKVNRAEHDKLAAEWTQRFAQEEIPGCEAPPAPVRNE